jgi:hypothetical protein
MEPGGKGAVDAVDAMSRLGDGRSENEHWRMAHQDESLPNKVPRFPMIATGLALLIIHSLIIIVLASLGDGP